jgi:hypothetical protein
MNSPNDLVEISAGCPGHESMEYDGYDGQYSFEECRGQEHMYGVV